MKKWALVGAALLLGACGSDGDSGEPGGSGGSGGSGGATPQVTEDQEAAYRHLNVAAVAALGLLTPYATEVAGVDQRHGDKLGGSGFHLFQDQGGGPDEPPPPDEPSGLNPEEDDDVRTSVGSSAPSCATFQWNLNLSATVTYDNCDVGSGVIIDGSLTLWIAFGPTTVGAQFDNLSIGANTFDGTVWLAFVGTEANPITVIGGDLDFDLGSGATQVSLESATVEIETDVGTTLDGTGSIQSSAFTGAITANDAFFGLGDCNPSKGNADLDLSGLPKMTAVFKATTPADGKVDAVIGPILIEDYPLLSPCS